MMSLRTALVALASASTFVIALPSAWAGPPTPLRSFTPSVSGSKFKTAAVCYDSRDVYVVAAVFTIRYRWRSRDVLYLLRIQGDSTAGNYGELISASRLGSERSIDHVDCTTDGGGNVFVAFDRRGAPGVFYRLDNTAVAGPFDLGHCETLRAYRPRIAYGNARVMVAYTGDNLDSSVGGRSCGVCSKQFALSGVLLVENLEFWRESTHTDYDVEFNGSQFVLAVQWRSDGWPLENSALSTLRYDMSGKEVSEQSVQDFTIGSSPAPPNRVRLTYSANAHNTYNRLFLQTNTGSYWLNIGGATVGSPVANNVSDRFGLCEYWGADNAVATVFSPYLRWTYTPGIPHGNWSSDFKTRRSHYGVSPALAYETSNINSNYVPYACEASATLTDSEVLVVSQTPIANANIYWNLQPSD
jgi:hypothetical protein